MEVTNVFSDKFAIISENVCSISLENVEKEGEFFY